MKNPNLQRRALAFVLCFIMMLSLLSSLSFAEEGTVPQDAAESLTEGPLEDPLMEETDPPAEPETAEAAPASDTPGETASAESSANSAPESVTEDALEDVIEEETETEEGQNALRGAGNGQKITYVVGDGDNPDIHYLPELTDENGNIISEKIILYCMNAARHWPHVSTDVGITSVPDYLDDGYLTEEKYIEMGGTKEKYASLMKALAALLYAGYPYNGLHLYNIVRTGSSASAGISEEQFNQILANVPAALRTDFPDSIGDNTFSYADFQTVTENTTKLLTFLSEEFALYQSGGTTQSGLTSQDIRATGFYKAASLAYYIGYGNILDTYANLYGTGSPNVTPNQAWNATQYAVWKLLNQYGVEDGRDVSVSDLGQSMLKKAPTAQLLEEMPSSSQISVSGNTAMTYDPFGGDWRTGLLEITEPSNYHGEYTINLPAGFSLLTDDGSATLTAGEKFTIVSDHQMTSQEISFSASLVYLKEIKQYSPEGDPPASDIDQTKFQHMVGAVIQKVPVSTSVTLTGTPEGSLTVSKTVAGERNSTQDFTFTVTLNRVITPGTYGDMTFANTGDENSTATFTLKHGVSKTASHLPAGVTYTVSETPVNGYESSSIGETGTIPSGSAATAAFTNTKQYYTLSVSKTVTGDFGDKTKEFSFQVEIKDASGNPATGLQFLITDASGNTVPYSGGFTIDATSAFSLKDGQTWTIKGLAYGYTYTVTEQGADALKADGYTISYNGDSTAASAAGTITANTNVAVENNKRYIPDTGISAAGTGRYAVLILFSLCGLSAVFALRRRPRRRS